MKKLGLISQVVQVIRKDGKFLRNPCIITDPDETPTRKIRESAAHE